jgi:hypothetical protein
MKTISKNITGLTITSGFNRRAGALGYIEKRSEARIAYQSRVKIKELKTGVFISGRMCHYSKNGVYIEINSLLLPGSENYIGIENSPFVPFENVYDVYRAEVKWLRVLNSKEYKYGCGLKLIVDVKKTF